ncbi:aminotransferase class III-fold pyridoxal phosphate-dependent enzyme [Dactylosporangium sp. NPDC000555]|uniref:aspartate aminotransferase family protein n=1 Tax=Dactylosporangium sp. NPDC000555 TaxID=3154260 RepID=UPI00332E3193
MTSTTSRATSADLADRARLTIPGGANSNVRLAAPRVFFERGKGAWLWDVDGNDYVDYLLGQGPNFLGHAHDRVVAAVAKASTSGMVFGAQHRLEVEAAERIVAALGWADMVRLGMTGTEAVQAALRLARAVTGRRRFVRFEGHYHGWLDNVLVNPGTDTVASAGQMASYLADSVVVPWNDAAALEAALAEHAEALAAVIMEPIMINSGSTEPADGYLPRVRELCTRYGVVLIFDEVISGFRVALGGAAQRYGVAPDLATYGKAMAGGWPVAALAGRAELMERFGTGEVNHSGTFNGSVMAAAAVVATLDVLTEDPPYERITRHGTALMAGLADLGRRHGVPLRVQGLPMAFHASFGPPDPVTDYRGLRTLDLDRYAAFSHALADHGVWVAGRGIWYVSAAHGEPELTAALERADRALTGHAAG